MSVGIGSVVGRSRDQSHTVTAHARRVLVASCLTAIAPLVGAKVCDGISEASSTPLTSVRVASGLTRPLFVTSPPGDLDRLFIVEQDGRIRILRSGTLLPDAFLDIANLTRSPGSGGGGEEGLLGLAFHPDYATNGWFFVFHTDLTGDNNLVVRYSRSMIDPDLADPASRQVVLVLPHPDWDVHNGGMVAFAPDDGYLYIAVGDAAQGCNAQDGTSYLGKLLRIDVDSLPYSVPPDNPFVGADGYNDEIWAMGLRNPWRFSFDSATSDLYLADVGREDWEEIDYRLAPDPGGENYGWPIHEGDHCTGFTCGSVTCPVSGHIPPVLEYGHSGGACAVTGGYVYRGCRMPDLRGIYFYADYCAAFIGSFRIAGGAVTELADRTADLAPAGGLVLGQITSFGEDARGEIYVVDRGSFTSEGGEVYKIVPILPNLEVSGPGAEAFVPRGLGEDWAWEDLRATSSHPISAYRVYRSQGNGSGPLDCVHETPTPSWVGGDPADPVPGGLLSYVVTAVNPSGQETGAGVGSGGTPRLLTADPCPP